MHGGSKSIPAACGQFAHLQLGLFQDVEVQLGAALGLPWAAYRPQCGAAGQQHVGDDIGQLRGIFARRSRAG